MKHKIAMSKFISKKVQLKNIFIGVAIGLVVMFLVGLIFYYLFVFLPYQETKRMQKQMEEYERLFWEYQKEPKIQQ